MKGNNLALGGFANVALEKEKLAAAIVKLKAENTDHPGRLPYYGSDGARLTSEVRMLRVGKPDIAAGGLGLFLNLPDTFRVPLAHEPGDGLFSEAVKAIEHEFEQSDRVYPSGATDRLLLKYILYGRTGAPDEIMVRRNDGTSEGPLSLVPNYWLRWECLGTRKPDTWKRSGDKLSKTTSVQAVMLSNALESKYAALRSEPPAAESQPPRANTVVIFTEEEWEQIGLAGLRRSHYIKSGGKYFQPSDPGRFPNGSIDEGHAPGLSLDDFYNHENSKNARLTKAHVLALRIYSTAGYESLNNPLRTQGTNAGASRRRRLTKPHPFPVTLHYLDDAIKKLRSLNDGQDEKLHYLWRGLRDTKIDSVRLPAAGKGSRDRAGSLAEAVLSSQVSIGTNFRGTEFAPMSTTTSLEVALKYSVPGASHSSILMQINTRTFLDRGADLSYLSAFPREREFLYPPLTYLEAVDDFTLVTDNNEQFRVLRVNATMP